MKNKLLVILFLNLALLSAKIVDIKSIQEAKAYFRQEQLIVLDLDNTLMTPIQELGTDQWFYYYYNECQNQGFTQKEALYKSLRQWAAIQGFTQMKLVEPEVKNIIEELQAKNYTTMGMTTRDISFCVCTLDQLRILGVNLELTAPSKKEHYLNNEGSVLFRQGVLFTSGTHKGRSLLSTLNALNYNPKSILFINDKRSNIEPVEEECSRRGIEFIGLRYSYLDKKVAGFNKSIAKVQQENFGTIMSDAQAEQILAMNK